MSPTNGRSDSESGAAEPSEPGVVLRPTPAILGDDALVPPTNLVEPRSVVLSHELTEDEPFWFDGVSPDDPPSGTLAKGTRVSVLGASADRLRVADQSGLAVDVKPEHVREIE